MKKADFEFRIGVDHSSRSFGVAVCLVALVPFVTWCLSCEKGGNGSGFPRVARENTKNSAREVSKAPGQPGGAGGREAVGQIVDETAFGKMVDETAVEKLPDLFGVIDAAIRKNPREALRLIDGLQAGEKRNQLLRYLFQEYPKDESGELILWADTSAFGEDCQLVYPLLGSDTCRVDADEALKMVAAVGREELRDRLVCHAAWKLADDPQFSLDMAKNVAGRAPPELRGRFLDQYVSGVVARDAALGMEMLLADGSDFGAGVRESSATKVGFTCPEKLADRMLECVAGTSNSDMLAPFVRGWLSNNSTKASGWVNEALTGTTRDIALAEVVRFLVSKGDYDTAKAYRQAIVDESIRDDVHVP